MKAEVYDWLVTLIKEEHIPFTVHAGQYNTDSMRKAPLWRPENQSGFTYFG
ncbi:MAG: hypothetical protein ACLSFZ_02695 [Frisingicoccus sp.]